MTYPKILLGAVGALALLGTVGWGIINSAHAQSAKPTPAGTNNHACACQKNSANPGQCGCAKNPTGTCGSANGGTCQCGKQI